MRASFLCVIFTFALFISTVALAEPTVTIDTDKDAYSSGDTIEVTLEAENPDASTALDFCVGLLTPAGGIYTLGPSGWVASIVPWSAEMRMPTQFDMTAHLYFEVPSTLPMPPIYEDGQYQFASLLLEPGTWTWASDLSLAPFTYGRISPSITMLSIPAGSFLMGSPTDELGHYKNEAPQRTVNISAFMMSETEVTQKQWEEVMGWNDSDFIGDYHPVEEVTWYDCMAFCNALSEIEGLTCCYTITNISHDGDHIDSADVTCDFGANGYRLPTEAEWEYACRAGTTTRFFAGDSESDLGRAGWYSSNSGSQTHNVAQKEANPWGLYDVHGNVWEWCWDWFDAAYYGTRPDPDSDPTGPASGVNPLLRGGSWHWSASTCRSAFRFADFPWLRGYDYGFRLAKSQ